MLVNKAAKKVLVPVRSICYEVLLEVAKGPVLGQTMSHNFAFVGGHASLSLLLQPWTVKLALRFHQMK